MSDPEDRTLPATPTRRAEAIEQGARPTVAVPASLASLAALMAVVVITLPFLEDAVCRLMRASVSAAVPERLAPSDLGWVPHGDRDVDDITTSVIRIGVVLFGILVVPAVVSLMIHMVVDRPVPSPHRFAPTFRRVNPAAGLARMFRGAWTRVCSNLLAGLASGAACVAALRHAAGMNGFSEPIPASTALREGMRATAVVLTACAAIAIVRHWLSLRRFERSIRMTPREYEEERRRLEPATAIARERSAIRSRPTSHHRRSGRPAEGIDQEVGAAVS